mgnify:CR=1 FL=1
MSRVRLKFFVSIGVVLLTISLAGCWGNSQAKKTGLVVINVLDRNLYDDCHIKDSIHVPFDAIEQYAKGIDKNAEIVIYCSNYMCATSSYAASKLSEIGFANVRVYEGGVAEWFQKGLPVEGPGRQSYLSKAMKPMNVDENPVPVITAEELARKMGMKSSSIDV